MGLNSSSSERLLNEVVRLLNEVDENAEQSGRVLTANSWKPTEIPCH